MGHCRWGMLKFTGICLVMLMVWCSVGVAATAPQSENLVQPPAEEEAAPEQKPPEQPPALLPSYYPGIVPSTLAGYNLTFAPTVITGFVAPYGYGAVDDTLMRGWELYRLGPVVATPYLEYDGIYRTNVFQTYNDKKSDYVNTITPGIRFELPIAGQHSLSLGYLGNEFIYSRNYDLSHYDQNLNADAALNFSNLNVKFGSVFRAATEEPSALTSPLPFVPGRERDYYRTTPYFQVAYKVADLWRLEGNYQFDDLSFRSEKDNIDDYQYNTLGATLLYKFWPKTSALMQYVAVIRNHPFNSQFNNTVQTPLAGLTWEPTAKLSGTVKFGYSFTDYYQKIPGRNNSLDTWALSIQTIYKISRYTQLSLLAQRGIQEDVDYDLNPYTSSGLSLTLSHFWHAINVTSYLAFSYYNSDYLYTTVDPVTSTLLKRNDDYYSFGVGLSRPITKWLKVRLDYLYADRGSNLSYSSFNEHKVMLGLQTSF
jgi:polysaccharide biosynthesis protein VpsM